MLSQIETLIALKKNQTMVKTSTAMRVSQSTISKRISSLESTYKTKLVRKRGRNVYLTAEAESLIKEVSPLLLKIKDALNQKTNLKRERYKVKLGVSESILSSWGPKKILPIFDNLNIEYELHCHRSPAVQDKIASGDYDLGVCVGKPKLSTSLVFDLMTTEEMVLVSTRKDQVEIACIEESASTWKDIKTKVDFNIDLRLESFFSVGQIAKSGKLKGLIPKGVSEELGFKKTQVKSLTPKIKRHIWLIYRKSNLDNEDFKKLIHSLTKIKNY